MSGATPDDPTLAWWGRFSVPHGQCGCWQIGPLTMWVQRLQGEWRVARRTSADGAGAEVRCEVPALDATMPGLESANRFGVSGDDESLTIAPALADRPVVSSPESAFTIPAGEAITIYVGSPVWMQLAVGDGDTALVDVPIHTPSDTWFGPNTQQGEICYASRSFCRLRREDLIRLPHRATTTVNIRNQASSPLNLEQMKMPVPYLSLFCDSSNGALWTEDVVFEREQDDDLAPLRIRKGAPAAVPHATRVAEPRVHVAGNIMVRAFSSLLSN